MDIYFKTEKLKKIFNDNDLLIKQYGAKQAFKIQIRLTALRAAISLYDFHPPRSGSEQCHELLSGLKKGQSILLSMNLVQPYRLIFVPANEPIIYKADGGLNWKHVTAVEIWEVRDTHDGKKK